VPFEQDSKFLGTVFFEASLFATDGATETEPLGVDEGVSFLCALKYFDASSLLPKLFQTASG
jgi:hypothetical protein